MVRRRPNVRASRACDESLRLLAERRGQQGLYRGPDPVDDGPQTRRLLRRGLAQLLYGGHNGAAFRVPEHDDKPRAEACGRKLYAPDLRRRHDVPSYPDDEQVAKALPEDEFGGDARVRASEHNGEGLLAIGEGEATRLVERGRVCYAPDKPPVALSAGATLH
jgi:hypothetical protein